jgi:hypothetical protein
MPALKLTKGVAARLRAPDPSGKQKLVRDTELKGFGVLVSGVTNARTLHRAAHPPRRAHPSVRLPDGHCGALSTNTSPPTRI